MNAPAPHQGNLVPTPSLKAAVGFVDQIIEQREGLFLLTGPAGIGKSAVLQYCRERSSERAIVLVHVLRRVDADNLSGLLNEVFSVDSAGDRGSRAQALRYFLKLGTLRAKGKRFVLVLEDVEEVHSSGSELIRALLQMKAQDKSLVTIILSGQLQLDALLDRTYRWGLQKLISDSHQMAPLTLAESSPLIDSISALRGGAHVPFRRGARKLLLKLAQGIPGNILTLGNRAANIARRTKARAVSARMVRGAATGDYQSAFDIVANSAWKVSLAIIILLMIPIAIVQQGISPTGFSERPIGGLEQATAPTAEEPPSQTQTAANTATAIQPQPAELPAPKTREDDIALPPATTIAIATSVQAPNDSPAWTSFILQIPPPIQSEPTFETVRTELPSWQQIHRNLFAGFSREIPPKPR